MIQGYNPRATPQVWNSSGYICKGSCFLFLGTLVVWMGFLALSKTSCPKTLRPLVSLFNSGLPGHSFISHIVASLRWKGCWSSLASDTLAVQAAAASSGPAQLVHEGTGLEARLPECPAHARSFQHTHCLVPTSARGFTSLMPYVPHDTRPFCLPLSVTVTLDAEGFLEGLRNQGQLPAILSALPGNTEHSYVRELGCASKT